ncbi:protein crumbs isoform X1 [Drosophila simulans]|uniref:protein crumbs isoform X1 n=1 Tax=Drosophila simulans TaxID=7240 RepID=UPI00192CF6AF|nr:protein crumbs isoform X1 [Drosophila simulans]
MAKIANASLSQQQKQRQAATATTTTTTVAASVETATTTARSRDRTKSAAQITSHLLKRAISVYSSPQWIPLFILIYLATDVASVAVPTKEAYFNGSTYLRLTTPMPIWDHSAISFRSCRGGEILAQQYNKNSIVISVLNDFLQISLAGPAVHGPNNRLDVKLPYQLLDNRWHTLQFKYEYGNLYLHVDRAASIFANSTYNSQFLTNQDIGYKDAILILGNSFSGCLLDGPGLQFVNNSTVQNVVFGHCPLTPGPCSDHDLFTRLPDNFCLNDPCMGHGTCSSSPEGYECRCTARYSGKNCQKDNGSPCAKNPCENGGSCLENSRGDYQCFCDPNHSGQHCETEVNIHPLCQTNPCLNNGACVVIGGSGALTCECPKGYAGARCEVDTDECASQPCQNNGSCIDRINGFSCDCSGTGYTGAFCQTNVDECDKNPCLNGGRCFDTYGWYTCQCLDGWGGEICDRPMTCQTQQCLNGGTCLDKPIGFQCLCPPEYTGELCQIAPSCAQQCPIDSECVGGKCVCKPGSSGPIGHCLPTTTTPTPEQEPTTTPRTTANPNPAIPNTLTTTTKIPPITTSRTPVGTTTGSRKPPQQPLQSPTQRSASLNACPQENCLNGGTCLGYSGNYSCICASGYTGYNCQTSTGDGASALALTPINCNATNGKCLNGGTCSMNGTHCYCAVGYSGDRCEKAENCSPLNCQEPMVCVQNQCLCPENKVCNQCATQPCQNGGECVDLPNGDYECKCTRGWTGRTCGNDVDECTLHPKICGNGICKNEKGSYKCYCTPGFTGVHCDSDVDECLSFPCLNGATCHNKLFFFKFGKHRILRQINAYECVCQPGYEGENCEVDIDECGSNPCSNGSTCIDRINNFTCNCIPGMTGRICDIDIDDCVGDPCLNGGQCIDQLGGFRCDCSGTGYEGENCELNIDECLSNPCTNGAKCLDRVKDYFCDCHNGYKGKNCEQDINECESNPCQYNGNCLERSNMTLYQMSRITDLPKVFSQPFSFENASGYECVCVPGIIGKNCEININECDSNPCSKHGNCNDGIGTYTCECEPGFEGTHCEINIDECDRYNPCQRGTCYDQIDDYDCDCDANYGGKNCSVLLKGCDQNPCLNGGACLPYLINEVTHLYNCTCENGFQGDKCEKTTTLSMVATSLISVTTEREEGYDINLQFRTTLPNGVLAFGTTGEKNEPVSYILELINGRLNLHSSLLNKWEGVFIGSKLNDSNWHKVFVAINTSHLVLSANDEQAIFPVGSYETANNSQPSFPRTYLGGTIPNLKSYLRHLTHQPSAFVGCMQDIMVNGKWIFPEEQDANVSYTKLENVQSGCPRTEQCKPNPCHSNGECTDLWHTFACHCPRPFFGHTCQHNMTAATFGHENTTHSAVIVETTDVARRAIRSILDISMFIRTREPTGQVFYLGTDPRKAPTKNIGDSYVAAKLHGGELLVKMQFSGTPEAYTVGGQKLDNGYNHLIEVVRNQTLVQVKLNGTEYFRKTLSTTGLLDAQVLYLGGPAPTRESLLGATTEPGIIPVPGAGVPIEDTTVPKEADDSRDYFKGIIQDVKVSNGSLNLIVEMYSLNVTDVQVNAKPLGAVTIDRASVLPGEVSDDLCRKNPCLHNAECRNTWNDYTCKCPNGYKGKNCQEIEFCQHVTCPGQSLCQNLDDGYECVTNTTFTGQERSPLAFFYFQEPQSDDIVSETAPKQTLKPVIDIAFRTRAGGTLLYIDNVDGFFEIGVNGGRVTITWKLSALHFGESARFEKENTDGEWSRIYLRAHNSKLEGGWKGWESMVDPTPAFSTDIDQAAFQSLIATSTQVYLGGMPESRQARGSTLSAQQGSQFKGCVGEARVGDLLLPYFSMAELYSRTNVSVQQKAQFRLNATRPEEGCILCFQSDCKNDGFCQSPSDEYACTCQPGFEGDDCGTDIDECLNTECLNNGTCINQVAAFFCQCQPGFEGQHCEQNIDECADQPCHNGGNCTDLIASYVCDCPEDYMGPQCDVLKQMTCENEPCRNGSTCQNGFNASTGNNFTCTCVPGFEGPLCDIPFCEITPCDNGGLCLTTGAVPMCKCSLGYTGRLCEQDINECESNPCQNGGQCKDLVGRYECDCQGTGFEGIRCENDIDECNVEGDYCGGLGRCFNKPGSFQCICQKPYCGAYCNFTDPCNATDLCSNGGRCVESCGAKPDYYCECPEGFAGKNCTAPITAKEDGPSTTDIAIIVIPVVVVLLLIAGALLGTFLVMARNKRATRGTYSPSAQEYCNPRLEMDNVLKPPPEERLI